VRHTAKFVETDQHFADKIIFGNLVFRLIALIVGYHVCRHRHTARQGFGDSCLHI
jgi:hypothetical protein